MYFTVVYFSLSNDSTLTTQNYIGAAVDLDPNTVYVGQLLFTNGLYLPQSSMTTGSLYGYQNTAASNTTVTGRSFATIDYVIKIPPGSLYGYNFQTCNRSKINKIYLSLKTLIYLINISID